MTLVPGFVRRGTALGIGAGTGLHLRGSGSEATAVYIDGAPVRNQITGVPGLTLPLAAVQSMTVMRGVSDIGLADGAGGGVIEYATRTGGNHLDGGLRAATDAPFGTGSSVGYNRFAGTVGGPAGPRVSWFAAGEVTGQRSAYRGWGADKVPAFVWGGVDTVVDTVAIPNFVETTGLRRPLDWLTERRAVGNIVLRLGGSSQVGLTGVINDVQRRFYPENDIGDTALFSGAHTTARLAVASWTQSLGSRHPAPALHIVVSLMHENSSSGSLTSDSQSASADPSLGIEWSSLAFLGTDSIPRLTDQILRDIRSNAGLRVPFFNQTSLRDVQPYRLNPYGLVAGWPSQGIGSGFLSLAVETRFSGRSWVDWPITPRHFLRAGLDYDRASQRSYRSGFLSEIDLDAWIARPRRVGVFAADYTRLGDVAVDVGVRFDHFTPGGLVPLVPGRLFSNPAWNPQSATDDTAYTASLARVYRTAPGKSAVSPRLRVRYVASPHTALHLSVGQQIEPPSSATVFGGSNNDLSFSSFSSGFGQDVGYVKSTVVELGIDQQALAHLQLGLNGYHLTRALYVYRIAAFDDPANPGRTLNVVVPASLDSLGASGLEANLDWTPASPVSGRLAYAFEHSEGFSTQALQALLLVTTPATGASVLRDFSILASVRAESGRPFLPGSGVTVPTSDDEFPLYSVVALRRLPWTRTVDLRLARRISLARFSGSLYADLRNALNFRNAIGAYSRTGTQTDAINQTTVLAPEFSSLQIEAQANGVLLSGNAVDLRPDCGTWTGTAAGPVNCAALRLVERRFGNGDGVYDMNEQTAALNAYYEAFFGTARFFAPGRSARIGLEISF